MFFFSCAKFCLHIYRNVLICHSHSWAIIVLLRLTFSLEMEVFLSLYILLFCSTQVSGRIMRIMVIGFDSSITIADARSDGMMDETLEMDS